MDQNTVPKALKTLLYWRQSKLNGMLCKPAIVSMEEDGTVSLKDHDGKVQFSVPAQSLTARFTGWGTMVLTANGTSYDIVGSGAGVSPDPTEEQLNEIKAAAGANTTDDNVLTKVGGAAATFSTVSPAAGVAGSAATTYAYYQGLPAIKTWQEALASRGATVQKSKMNNLMYFLLIGLPIIIVLGILFLNLTDR